MWEVVILTSWRGEGTEADSYRPDLIELFPITRYEDITGQDSATLKPMPNAYVVKIWCEADVLDIIEADTRFQILSAVEQVVLDA